MKVKGSQKLARNSATWGAVMIKAWKLGTWEGKIVEEGSKKG